LVSTVNRRIFVQKVIEIGEAIYSYAPKCTGVTYFWPTT